MTRVRIPRPSFNETPCHLGFGPSTPYFSLRSARSLPSPLNTTLNFLNMKLSFLAGAALIGLFSFTTPAVSAMTIAGTVLHDPAPPVEDSKTAATRIMTVLINDGLIANEQAAKLRTELTGIFEKTPLTVTGDAKKDATTKTKVKEQVQAAVLRHVGKDKSERVAALLAKPESWDAKACAKGKACCSGHK